MTICKKTIQHLNAKIKVQRKNTIYYMTIKQKDKFKNSVRIELGWEKM